MDKGSSKSLYLPSLASRLIDDERLGMLSEFDVLKAEILQNISLILNSRIRPERAALRDDPVLYRSVLGFGIKDFCGTTQSNEIIEDIIEEIRDQIITFEPRLDPKTVKVKQIATNIQVSSVGFEISGKMNVKPYNEDISYAFRFDLELGGPVQRLN